MAERQYVAGIEGLHETFVFAMGTQVLAPVNLTQSGLRILDSGCSNGRWLRDLENACAPTTHEFIGTDAAPDALPSEVPDNLQLSVQDICEPWPESWNGTFDLVHQRTVLVNVRKKPMKEVLAPMAQLLKPGGWIQLMEVEFPDIPENGPAMQDFLGVAAWFWEKAGPGRDLGPNLKRHLENLGLQDVQDRVVNVEFGAKLKDKAPEVVFGSVEGLCCAVPGSIITFQGKLIPHHILSAC